MCAQTHMEKINITAPPFYWEHLQSHKIDALKARCMNSGTPAGEQRLIEKYTHSHNHAG